MINIITLIVSVILILLTIYLLVKINAIRKEKSKQEYKNQLSQLNSHFIFNSLTAIQNYILTNETQDASKYLSSLAKLIRIAMENSRVDEVSLDKEINYLKLFFELQSLRFEGRFSYSLNIDSNVNTEVISIPPMLIQPYIDNAIEHGFIRFANNGHLNINIKLKNDNLIIEVEDIGEITSIEFIKEKYSPSFHLQNASEIAVQRINTINKINRSKIELVVNENYTSLNSMKGILVRYQIPL